MEDKENAKKSTPMEPERVTPMSEDKIFINYIFSKSRNKNKKTIRTIKYFDIFITNAPSQS